MRVLVTGNRGFIGSAIMEGLEKAGHMSCGFDLTDHLDIRNLDQVRQMVRGFRPEVICHQAAISGVHTCQEEVAECYQTNVIGTINVAQVCRETGIRMVFASSGAVYGGGENLREDPDSSSTKIIPRNQYGMSKYAAELAIRQMIMAGSGTPRWNILRYANVYGPEMGKHGKTSVVAIFSRHLDPQNYHCINQEPVTIYGVRVGVGHFEGDERGAVRDFVHISDVVRANIAAIEGQLHNHHYIMNVSSGQGHSIADLAELMGLEWKSGPPKQWDCYINTLNADRFKKDLGDPVTLQEGVADLCQRFRPS